MSEKYFPELCDKNGDPRATLFFGDGIQWMKDAAPGLHRPDHHRLHRPGWPGRRPVRQAFYLDCIKALKPNGLLVQQSESPLLHLELIKEMHQAMREAGFAQTTLLHFPQVIYPSGWWSGSIASKQAGPLAQRLDEKAIEALDTQFYNADTHRGAFALPTYVKKALAGALNPERGK